ncbi:unnamed protein product [Rhodiola kirilowii]
MPRSSRHKSKRSAKDTREYSDTEEDVSKGKHREGKDEGGSRGYKESGSGSGEKRKLASQSVVVKDSSAGGSGYSSEEYVGSKKRKDKSGKLESDRWNGSDEVLGLKSEIREGSSHFDGKVLKSKGLILLKSKVGSTKHDLEKKEENVGIVISKKESRSGKVESKRRLEKDTSETEKLDRDLNRKDVWEKEMGSERDNRLVDSKRELDYQAVDKEDQKVMKGLDRKDWPLEDEHGKCKSERDSERRRKGKTGESDDNDKHQDRKRDNSDINVTPRRERDKDGRDRDESHKDISIRDKHYWTLEEVYGKHESEKERETRRRKRTDESNDKDKSQDLNRDSSDTIVTSRRDRDKDGRDRDERHKDISSRDKSRDYFDRDSRGRDVDRREGTDRERTQKSDDYADDRASKCHVDRKNDLKYLRGEIDSLNSRHKKSRTDFSNFDTSVMYDDQSYRYKDYKETRGSMDKEDYGDMRSWGAKEYLGSEKKSAGAREEIVSKRERSLSLHPEESTLGQSRRTRSPSSTAHATRDQFRYSKQSETKYRKSQPEDMSRIDTNYGKEGDGSEVSDRAHSSRAVPKGDSDRVAGLSSERHRNTDRRVSPVRSADKSQSPSGTERRHLNRTGGRKTFDYEDSGNRSSGYKDKNYHYYDGKRNQDVKLEAPSMDGSSQVHGDNMPVSSSFTRSARIPGNSRSFLPPPSPLKHGVDNSYVGLSEEDGRGKLNNRPNRPIDSSMGRVQGNAWWGAPNWPSPMANGFLPFPHGPPAVGFHPMMQQFSPQMFGVRPPMDPTGVPFHTPDGDRFPGYGHPFGWPNSADETCPSPMQNWDSNNMVPGEGYAQGRDWDQNRSLLSNAGREPSVDRYKGANSATMESPSGRRRATVEPIDNLSSQSNHGLKNEACQSDHLIDEASNDYQFGSKLSSEMSGSFKEISNRMSNAKVSEGKHKKVDDVDDHVRRSCAYLSKIDISVSLAHSDVFDQCVSWLGIKQDTLSDTRMSGYSLEEENAMELRRSTLNSYVSRGPMFAEVSGSLFEKAMSLYRQHRDDTNMISYLSDKSNGNQVLPSPEIQSYEPSPCLDGRVPLLASSQFGEYNDQASMRPGPVSEYPASNIHPMPEIHSPASFGNLDEDVANKPDVPINTISTSDEVKDELNSVSDRKVSENTDSHKRIGNIDADDGKKTVESTNIDVDEAATVINTSIATNSNAEAGSRPVEDDDGSEEGEDEHATPTNVPFEGCEDTVMTELNELGSVNLSRIQQPPESTH